MKVEYVRYVFGIHPHMCPLSSVKVDQPRPRCRRGKKQLFRMIISVCLNLRGKNHTGGPGQLGWCRVSQPPKRRVKPTLTCRSLSVCVHANLKQMLKSVCQIVTTSSLDPVEIYFFFFFFFSDTCISFPWLFYALSHPVWLLRGRKCYALLPAAEGTDRQQHIKTIWITERRNRSGPWAHDRRCYWSINCHLKALWVHDLFIQRGTLADVE